LGLSYVKTVWTIASVPLHDGIAGATYENFVEDLKEAEELRQCRYGVFDAEYKLKDGQSRQKLVFFLWYVRRH